MDTFFDLTITRVVDLKGFRKYKKKWDATYFQGRIVAIGPVDLLYIATYYLVKTLD